MMKSQQRMKCLDFYEEAVGDLSELIVDQGFLIARVSKVVIALPIDMENKLLPLMGARIGILRTDIPGKEYLVRCSKEAPSMDRAALNPTLQTAYEGVRA